MIYLLLLLIISLLNCLPKIKMASFDINKMSYIDNYLSDNLFMDNFNFNSIYYPFLTSIRNCKSYSRSEMLNRNNSNYFNILNLNTCSILKKLDDIQMFLDMINMNFDSISFTEPWLKPRNENLASLNNYF